MAGSRDEAEVCRRTSLVDEILFYKESRIYIRARLRVGVAMADSVAFRRRALTALGEILSWAGKLLNGGMFSLLESSSTTTVVVRARFGLGVLSGVRSCSQELGGKES